MQPAIRPLKLLLDRLADTRWAPLAAPVDGALTAPDLQLAAFSADPFASLQRDAVKAGAAEAPGASPSARRPAAAVGTAARKPRMSWPAALPASHEPDAAAGAEPVADVPPWRPRPAAPGLPQLVPMPWPALPKARSAAGVPALEATALQALIARFTPAAADAPPLDAVQLRALATPRPVPASPVSSASSAAAPPAARQAAFAPQRVAPANPLAAPVVRRPLPEPAVPADALGVNRPDAATLPTPRGRASALAELLQRWPGAQAADADAPVSPAGFVAPPLAEFAPMPSAQGTPLSSADLPAAFGSELPRPQAAASDLQFSRTLERVLLAEVRRQGLEPDAS
ncbi:MAG: hypothetical protein EOP35_08710 [Rubrivivax sp.]|nr:MAG: hypothetical protein EOP35_08710 [Rubrivivax sp.]